LKHSKRSVTTGRQVMRGVDGTSAKKAFQDRSGRPGGSGASETRRGTRFRERSEQEARSAGRRKEGNTFSRKGLIITRHAPHARPLGCVLREGESFRALMARGLCPKSLSPVGLKVYNIQVKTTPPWVLTT
jgi:hypothetical protein